MHHFSAALHRLKERLESFAERKYALYVLFLVAFVEASVFPVPPDVLFVALAVSLPRSSFLFATICIVGSVSGAMTGYAIGAVVFDAAGQTIIDALGLGIRFAAVLQMYHDNAWLTLLLAGFTTIPFAVFSLAAGFRHTLDPGTFFAGALAGRLIRFYLLGILFFLFGPAMKRFIDRYLLAVSLAVVLLVALGLLWAGG